MSKNNSLIDELPNTKHQFMLDLQGNITKKLFKGEFECKIPTIKDQAMIAKHQAMLNGEFPLYLDASVKSVHKMLSYLRYTLTEVPLFWKNSDLGYELRDVNIIEFVYHEVLAFEDDWLKQVWGHAETQEVENEQD